jgi:hypothetical protein
MRQEGKKLRTCVTCADANEHLQSSDLGRVDERASTIIQLQNESQHAVSGGCDHERLKGVVQIVCRYLHDKTHPKQVLFLKRQRETDHIITNEQPTQHSNSTFTLNIHTQHSPTSTTSAIISIARAKNRYGPSHAYVFNRHVPR